MKILVTGANGQLGSEMRVLSLSYNTFEWVFADKKQLNLADLINLESKLEIISPDLIINSAAYTNVANAENERKIATAWVKYIYSVCDVHYDNHDGTVAYNPSLGVAGIC